MTDIRINQLPAEAAPAPTDVVPIDGATTRKTTISDLVVVGRPTASQAEAEAGTDPLKVMTPLTTSQAVDFYGLTKAGNLAGLASQAASRTNLGLGSAATHPDTDFATAAQGALAATAVQPTRTFTAGIGLAGGGDLSADRAYALNAASIASLLLADSSIQPEDVALSLVNFPGANDNARFTAAIAAAAALGNGATLFVPRGTYSITQKTVPANVRIALDKGAVIQPSGATASLFNFTGGLSGLSGGLLVNTGSLATDGVRVAKAADNAACVISDVYLSGFTAAIKMSSGDRLRVDSCTSVNNTNFVQVTDDGRNSIITKNYVLGGNGVRFQKSAQGGEGVFITENWMLPSSGGSFCVSLECGLEMTISNNIFDQITTGPAINIDGQTNPIYSIKISENWIGRATGAASADYGIYVVGNVKAVISTKNTFIGFRQAGINLNGVSAGNLQSFKSDKDIFYVADPCVRDINLTNAENVHITGAKFGGTISIVENSGVTGRVDMCDYTLSLRPSSVSGGLKYGRQAAGMVLRNKGTATVAAAGQTVTVNHGLNFTPSAQDISIEANSFPTNAPGELVSDTIGATSFRAVTRNNVGASGFDIKWEVDMER